MHVLVRLSLSCTVSEYALHIYYSFVSHLIYVNWLFAHTVSPNVSHLLAVTGFFFVVVVVVTGKPIRIFFSKFHFQFSMPIKKK